MTNLQDAMTRVDNEPELAAQRPQIWEWLKSEPYRADLIARGDVGDILERVDVRESARWANGRFAELLAQGKGMEAGSLIFGERLSKLPTDVATALQEFVSPNDRLRFAKMGTKQLTSEAQRLTSSHTYLDPVTGQPKAIKRAETFGERTSRQAAEQAAKAAQYKAGRADFSHMPKLGAL